MRGNWIAHPDTGRIYSNSTGDFLKPALKAGYPSLRIRLSFGDKEICGCVSVHRAMWVLCRGIPLSLAAEVDHIDGNRENNCLANLRLVPAEENTVRNLTYKEAEEIRRRSAAGESRRDLAAEFHVGRSTVQRILSGKTHNRPPGKMVCGRL